MAMATSGDRDDARRGGPAMARMIGSLARLIQRGGELVLTAVHNTT